MMPFFRRSTNRSASNGLDREPSLLRPLLVGLAAVMLALGFVHLGSEVVEGETHAFDMWLLHRAQALRAARPWVTELMRDLSGLGSTVVLTLFTLVTVGYLALVRNRQMAMLVAVSVLSGSFLVTLLKTVFGRLRPDITYAALATPGLSFPSGHASMAAVVFLTIAALLASSRGRVRERTFILISAAVLTLLVGVSRVALGVHWATDVLGGWAFGAGWAMAWLLLARSLTRSPRA